MKNDLKDVKTGIHELDNVLAGGLTANRVYLLHGTPGAGKTTLSLQFLLEGVKNNENVLYVTLSETRKELVASAATHGWNLDKINIFELNYENELNTENQYTMYQPSELELSLTTKAILAEIERINPTRVVIDSLSEVKLLAQSPLRYRRQILALKQYFLGKECTVLLLDDKTLIGEDDQQLESIAHGVISLEQLLPEYGAERRRLRITKLRGKKYRGGYHDFAIAHGGLNIFPRLVAAEHIEKPFKGQLKSGIKEIDDLLSGGIELGTSMLLLGPAGAGKSTLSLQYAISAAEKGERSAIFAFDERLHTLYTRAHGMGMDLEKYVDKGLITIHPIDPAELSPGEFVYNVKDAVEGKDGKKPASVIVIDSLNGYINSMPEERFLIAQLHELLTFLGHKGVVTFLVVAQHGLVGNSMRTPIDTTYLADSVMLFRYYEDEGDIKQAISSIKKRTGNHEKAIREFKMTSKGIVVGEPLRQLRGILTGTPKKEILK